MYEPVWRRPRSKAEALAVLADAGASSTVIAGGTDLTPLITAGRLHPEVLVDLGAAEDLAYVRVGASESGVGTVEIGATVTHAVLSRGARTLSAGVLSAACATVGGPQIRARGTIGGNLANASPAADGAVALTALGASAVLESAAGRREVPLPEFFTGPGQSTLSVGELLTGVRFERPSDRARGVYMKEGQRNALAIAVVSVAVVHEPDAGTVRMALGSVAPTPVRAEEAEALFAAEWERAGDRGALVRAVAAAAGRAASPIDDVRASAAYRRKLLEIAARRALEEVCAPARRSGR